MNKDEKIKQFKSALDAIDLVFELSGEQLNITKRRAFIDNIVYLEIKHFTVPNKRVEYQIQYRVDYDIIVLEISYLGTYSDIVSKKIKEILQYNGNVQIEECKGRVTSRFYYKFDELHLLTSIGSLMLEFNRKER